MDPFIQRFCSKHKYSIIVQLPFAACEEHRCGGVCTWKSHTQHLLAYGVQQDILLVWISFAQSPCKRCQHLCRDAFHAAVQESAQPRQKLGRRILLLGAQARQCAKELCPVCRFASNALSRSSRAAQACLVRHVPDQLRQIFLAKFPKGGSTRGLGQGAEDGQRLQTAQAKALLVGSGLGRAAKGEPPGRSPDASRRAGGHNAAQAAGRWWRRAAQTHLSHDMGRYGTVG